MSKVLIIDDDRMLCKLFAKQLKKSNYDIHFASNGQEGLEVAYEIKPDLIILDYQMPIMSGNIMLALLRETEWGKHIRVIMVTAASSINNLPGTETADLVLYKPVCSQELNTMAERLLYLTAQSSAQIRSSVHM